MKHKVIFCVGLNVRCGTNYIGSIMREHEQVSSVPKKYSQGEYNLYKGGAMDKLFNNLLNHSFGLDLKEKEKSELMQQSSELILNYVLDHYKIDPEKTVFLKSPDVFSYAQFRRSFPDAKILLLVRNPLSQINSVMRGNNDKRQWYSWAQKIKKLVNYYSGRMFRTVLKDYKSRAQLYLSIAEEPNTLKLKFEDILKDDEVLKKLLQFMELDASDEIIASLRKAPVIGSSWGVDEKGNKKPNWDPATSTEINKRKKKLNPVFSLIARSYLKAEMKALHYQ